MESSLDEAKHDDATPDEYAHPLVCVLPRHRVFEGERLMDVLLSEIMSR